VSPARRMDGAVNQVLGAQVVRLLGGNGWGAPIVFCSAKSCGHRKFGKGKFKAGSNIDDLRAGNLKPKGRFGTKTGIEAGKKQKPGKENIPWQMWEAAWARDLKPVNG